MLDTGQAPERHGLRACLGACMPVCVHVCVSLHVLPKCHNASCLTCSWPSSMPDRTVEGTACRKSGEALKPTEEGDLASHEMSGWVRSRSKATALSYFFVSVFFFFSSPRHALQQSSSSSSSGCRRGRASPGQLVQRIKTPFQLLVSPRILFFSHGRRRKLIKAP